jgi:hypothetical protein
VRATTSLVQQPLHLHRLTCLLPRKSLLQPRPTQCLLLRLPLKFLPSKRHEVFDFSQEWLII